MPYYIEKDGKPVLVDNVLEWARWFETADRTIRLTKIQELDVFAISTVFIGTGIGSEEYPSYCYESAYILRYSTSNEKIIVFERSQSRETALARHQGYLNAYRSIKGELNIIEDIINPPNKMLNDIDPLDRFEIID